MAFQSKMCMLLVILLATACDYGLEQAPGTYNNDFEIMGYWGNPSKLTQEMSRSGKYSTFTDREHEFSETFSLKLKEVSKPVKSVKLNVWIRSQTRDAKAVLVLALDSQGKTIFWKGAEVQKWLLKRDTWTEITIEENLPDNLPEDAVLKIYGWNNGDHRVYWDDFVIRVE